MVFRTPEMRDDEKEVLALLTNQREQLRDRVAEPRRWTGTLRRMAFARAVQGSNSIEGYNASLDDVIAAVDDEPTLDASEETQHALTGYRDAMTYVLQLARAGEPKVDEGLLKSLHFMMLKYDLTKNPGQWRPGDIYVRSEESGKIVYEGPPSDDVPDLISEMLTALAEDRSPVLVKAAMAHLNLVLIHPFSDGNGRMARCLQTLVLAGDRMLAPIFSSVEEFLGRNTQSYYDVLAEVGAGSWRPDRDARPWLRFTLRAHYLQVRLMLRRRGEIEQPVERLPRAHQPERATGTLRDRPDGCRLRHANSQGWLPDRGRAGHRRRDQSADSNPRPTGDGRPGATRTRWRAAQPLLPRRLDAGRALAADPIEPEIGHRRRPIRRRPRAPPTQPDLTATAAA